MAEYNWGIIHDGGTFESLMHALLGAEDDSIILFGRPGKDAGQDARSGDGKTVYQAKYREGMNMSMALKIAMEEHEKIKKYQHPDHENHIHWAKVKKWIMVGNFYHNANDVKKWNTQIVPQFQKIWLKAEYWELKKLEVLLDKHPEIANVFFEGSTRFFLGLKEAWERESKQFGMLLDISFVGRHAQLSKLEDFTKSNKWVLPICAPSGYGKTRFALEALRYLATNEWRVLWGCEASMTSSDRWFRHMNNGQRTCVVVDNPASSHMVKVLCEQLDLEERKHWKVILAYDSCREDIKSILEQKTMVDDTIDLPALQYAETKQLLKAILGEEVEDSWCHEICVYSGGTPFWIVLLADAARRNNVAGLPFLLDDVCARQVRRCLEHGNCETKDVGRMVLYWLALWGSINIDTVYPDSQQYLACLGVQGISPNQAQFWLEIFVQTGIAHYEPGYNKKYSINDMLIRHCLLRVWLLDDMTQRKTFNRTGLKLLQELAQGIISMRDEALRILTGLTDFVEFGGEQAWRCIFDSLEKEAAVKDQNGLSLLIKIIRDIARCDTERALEVFEIIFHRLGNLPEKKHLEIIYPQLLHSIASVAKDVVEPCVARRFILCLQRLTPQLPDGFDQDISRTLKKIWAHRNSFIFFQGAQPILNQLLTLEEFDFFSQRLFCETQIIVPERTVPTNYTEIGKLFYVEPLEIWKSITEIRIQLRELATTMVDPGTRCSLWHILEETNREYRKATNLGYKEDKYRQLLLDDMQCVKAYLEALPTLIIPEIAIMKKFWEPWLFFSSDDKSQEIRELARECQSCFLAGIPWNLPWLFKGDSKEDLRAAEDVASKILADAKEETLIQFFNDIHIYVRGITRSGQVFFPDGCLTVIAKRLQPASDPRKGGFLSAFVRNALQDGKDNLAWSFAVEICRNCLLSSKSTLRLPEIRSILELASDTRRFVLELYRLPHPRTTGEPIEEELNFFLEHESYFKDEEWFRLMGYYSYLNWKNILKSLKKRLNSMQEDLAQNCLSSFLESVYSLSIKFNQHMPLAGKAWFMFSILNFGLPPSSLTEYVVPKLHHATQFKFRVAHILRRIQSSSFFQKFMKDCRSREGSETWFLYNAADPREKEAFEHLCTLVLEPEFSSAVANAVACFDPEGIHVFSFIKSWLDAHPNATSLELKSLAYLSSEYPFGQSTWEAIARALCQACDSCSLQEREMVYYTLRSRIRHGSLENWITSYGNQQKTLDQLSHDVDKGWGDLLSYLSKYAKLNELSYTMLNEKFNNCL